MTLLAPLLLLACPPDADTDSDGIDSEPVVDVQDTGFCSDAPVIRYTNFGEAFLLHNCQGCHSSTTVNRHNAPEDVTFDTVEQVWALSALVLAVVTSEAPTMPPEGGLTDDDRAAVEYWLRCAPEGT